MRTRFVCGGATRRKPSVTELIESARARAEGPAQRDKLTVMRGLVMLWPFGAGKAYPLHPSRQAGRRDAARAPA